MKMKTYVVTFKLNGTRCQKTVEADSQANAKSQVQSFYPGEKLVWQGPPREVR